MFAVFPGLGCLTADWLRIIVLNDAEMPGVIILDPTRGCFRLSSCWVEGLFLLQRERH